MLFVGNDWAEAHHDIEIENGDGQVLARRRLPEGIDGLAALHALVGDHLAEDEEPEQVLVGIETDRGPWVQALVAAGYVVFAINQEVEPWLFRDRSRWTAGSCSRTGWVWSVR